MSQASRVLIVEDEPDIARSLEYNFKQAGFEVAVTSRGRDAIRMATARPPDLVLLDLMLPDLQGTEVCRTLKTDPKTRGVPVIMVTARGEEVDRVVGFEIGADDYVTKPFSPDELLARVRVALRRQADTAKPEPTAVYRGTHLLADFDAVAVSVDGAPIRLTRREFELLKYLVGNRNRVISRDRLLERVWGYDQVIETRSVDVHVGRLRAKLGSAGRQIETVVGLGYRFVE